MQMRNPYESPNTHKMWHILFLPFLTSSYSSLTANVRRAFTRTTCMKILTSQANMQTQDTIGICFIRARFLHHGSHVKSEHCTATYGSEVLYACYNLEVTWCSGWKGLEYPPSIQILCKIQTCSFIKWYRILHLKVAFEAPWSCARYSIKVFTMLFCIPP